jgi:hypothetical protein
MKQTARRHISEDCTKPWTRYDNNACYTTMNGLSQSDRYHTECRKSQFRFSAVLEIAGIPWMLQAYEAFVFSRIHVDLSVRNHFESHLQRKKEILRMLEWTTCGSRLEN